MPRLSKIRLVGCKYDGLTKEHENSIFDLTKDTEAVHSLFTLGNGGGKGVMMQLIFQLLLPETKWGKTNGNKIISMFYDKRSNLHSFTFHIALEWLLDTIPEKRLITGIAVKSIIKNTSGGDEEKTGLSYFLYTHEHDNNGYFKLENLPLYNEKNQTAEDLEWVENFINSNKRDFTKYSQSSVRRKDSEYYRYLENRGIYRNEWINLKTINKSEGGSGAYFIGASDNKSVFDKVIIPAISENLSNYTNDEGNSLIEMFKSNLSITKDLPLLIKQEASYRELVVKIKPLIENAISGKGFIDIQNRLVNEGNDLYFILNEEASSVSAEIEKWDNEGKKAKKVKEDLEYDRDNLSYNQEEIALEKTKKECAKLREICAVKDQEVIDNEEALLLYKINKVIYQKKKTEQEIRSKQLEKQTLVESLEISDIKAKANEVSQAIGSEWDKTKTFWINKENQYHGYIAYTNETIEQNRIIKKQYKSKIEALQKEVNKYEIKEEALEEDKKKLGQYYDAMALAFPENIAEDLIKMREKIEIAIGSKVVEIENCQKQLTKIKDEINQLEYTLASKAKEAINLQKVVAKQAAYEVEIAKKVAYQLLESYDGSLLDHHWFAGKQKDLESMGKSKEEKLEATRRTIWEKNIDRLLNKEDYFIPNKDILAVKSQIKQIGIHVETGSEYLQELTEENRAAFLSDYPGFLYAVVIATERDWELIDKNIDKNVFLNNMVPIYIRSKMESNQKQAFKILESKASLLVYQEDYIRWKNTLLGEVESLSRTEENLKNDLDHITAIKQELNIISKNDTALVLNQKLKKHEAEILEIREVIRNKEEEKLSTTSKMDMSETSLGADQNEYNKLKDAIKEIEDYIEKVNLIEADKKRIVKTKKDLQGLQTNSLEIEKSNDRITRAQNEIKDSYNKWQVRIESIIKDVKGVLKKAEYGYAVDKSYTNSNIPDFSIEADALIGLINEQKALNQSMAEKDNNIALLDNDLKHLGDSLERYQGDLQTLSQKWDAYPDLAISLDEIVIRIKELIKKSQDLKKTRESVYAELNTTQGSLTVMAEMLNAKNEQIFKEHKKYPVKIELKDAPKQSHLIERDIASNKRYLIVCYEELQNNKDKEAKLTINLTKIKTGYPLALTKGKMDEILKEKTKNNPDLVVDEWLRKCDNNRKQISKTVDEGEKFRSDFMKEMNVTLEESNLKEQVMTVIKEAKITNFNNNHISFGSMENHFQQELEKLSKDKGKAEDAMKQWTNRSAIHVMRMVEALKNMVSCMNYTNEQGYAFPLVKLKGAERLPKQESEITYLLDEYFVQAITEVIQKNEDVSNIDDKVLQDLMGDGVIFSKALQGRYPTLLVYKMSEKNEFRYARARDEYYTTWEAINKGEGISPEGSGGQTLSVNTFVIMMIMSFKKKHIGNENPSTVLILDNPFGAASAKYMLDPIFEIADKLNFQLICFAAPEIIKVEISERFPIFWELRVENGKIIHGGRIMRNN